MAMATKGSLAVRALALVFALALVALAARLWLGSGLRETSATRAASSERGEDESQDPVSTAPPLHGEHSAEDREALRDILRGDDREAP